MTTDVMELPRSGYKILRLIIIGYLHQGGSDRRPVTYEQVSKATSVNPTMVSGNNKALEGLGIVERSKGRGSYRLTPEGFELARALEFEEPELTRRALQPVLSNNETISTALNALRTRGPLPADGFANHLIMVAGGKKSTLNMTGARTIIEMLILAGLVEPGGDDALNIVRTPDRGATTTQTSDVEPLIDHEPELESGPVNRGGLQNAVNVQIDVAITADDLIDEERFNTILARLAQLRGITE